MYETFIPFPEAKNAIEIVNELLSNYTKDESVNLIEQRLATFNRLLDIHGYTPSDLKKVRMMREALTIIESK